MIAHIFDDLCTGCGTCVAACPTHVLDAGVDGKPLIARLDQCQTCFMCELYCDADALYVAPDQRVSEGVDPDAIRASGHLGRLRRDYGWNREREGPPALAEFWQLGPLLREGAEIAARRFAARHPTDELLQGSSGLGHERSRNIDIEVSGLSTRATPEKLNL